MSNEVVNNESKAVAPPLPYPQGMTTMGMSAASWKLLCDQFKSATQSSVVAKAWMLAKYHKLEGELFGGGLMHIFPFKDKKTGKYTDQIVPGIRMQRIFADKSGIWAGSDKPKFSDEFKTIRGNDCPLWAECTVWKMVQGVRCPFTAQVWLNEFYKDQGLWNSKPRYMLGVRAESAAMRKAFPSSNYAADVPVSVQGENPDKITIIHAPDDEAASQLAAPPPAPEPPPQPAAQQTTAKPARARKAKAVQTPAPAATPAPAPQPAPQTPPPAPTPAIEPDPPPQRAPDPDFSGGF